MKVAGNDFVYARQKRLPVPFCARSFHLILLLDCSAVGSNDDDDENMSDNVHSRYAYDPARFYYSSMTCICRMPANCFFLCENDYRPIDVDVASGLLTVKIEATKGPVRWFEVLFQFFCFTFCFSIWCISFFPQGSRLCDTFSKTD
jgi:hypothetical protein